MLNLEGQLAFTMYENATDAARAFDGITTTSDIAWTPPDGQYKFDGTVRRFATGIRMQMTGVRRLAFTLETLGGLSKEQRKTVQKVNRIVMMAYTFYMLHENITRFVRFLTKKDKVEAAAITAAYLTPPIVLVRGWQVALAATITAIVSFKLGAILAADGGERGSIDEYPIADIHDDYSRRQMWHHVEAEQTKRGK